MTFKNTKTYEGKRKNTLTVKKCEECLDITLIESYEDRRKISTHLLSIDNAIALRDYLNEAYPTWISIDDEFDFDVLEIDAFYYCSIKGGHPPELLQLVWDGDDQLFWENRSGQYDRPLRDVVEILKLPELPQKRTTKPLKGKDNE